MKIGLLLLVAASVTVYGQDPAMIAADQAVQTANQQAMEASQTANQQSMQASQQAMQDTGPVIGFASRPAFSIVSGKVTAGTTVRLKSSTRHAVIYYTTDGWTPTTLSTRYTGPIPINGPTHIEAIAVAPFCGRSGIAVANYTVSGATNEPPQAAVVTDGVLHAGTALRLVTDSEVNSKTAQVGDAVVLKLDEDLKAGDSIVVAKGAEVDATVSAVDRKGHFGAPGDITIEVHAIKAGNLTIPLSGTETLEGVDKTGTVRDISPIPGLGVGALFIRGKDAEIKPGMVLTASVSKDTRLHP
ncbi:MAG TPA: chitobiase/beta-hexosaminidase C-terminal domain-containing protein [Terracidiphilus sp.]|nr:chitobiase/beta-hexosaminidase C-terminal domain-containing protein [Terracidiphilus sp.]